MKCLTLRTSSKSLISLFLQKPQLVTSAILSRPNPVTTEELLPYQTIWGFPISKSYQASKCIIKAKDPRLHRISVTTSGFLTTSPIPKGTLTTDPILEGIPKVALPPQYTTGEATSSHPAITKEEEEKEEEVVEVSDSKDEFKVFNHPLSLKASTGDLGHHFLAQSSHHRGVTSIPDNMGIQRKPRSTLQELLES